MSKFHYSFILIAAVSTQGLGQDLPKDEPRFYRHSKKGLMLHPKMPLFLNLQSGNQQEKIEERTSFFSAHGPHRFSIKDGKKSHNYSFFVDAKPPRVDFTTNQKNVKGKRLPIYGKGLLFSLGSTDRDSGIATTKYSLNQSPFMDYKGSVPLNKEGQNSITYYAQDNVGNNAGLKTKSLIVDLTPPNLVSAS